MIAAELRTGDVVRTRAGTGWRYSVVAEVRPDRLVLADRQGWNPPTELDAAEAERLAERGDLEVRRP